jgi:alkylhydroperoxidase family enzyme
VGRAAGLTETDLTELDAFETADSFSDVDRLVLRLASEMTSTPSTIPVALREALIGHVGKAAFAELAATVAWENHRARLNRALDVQEAGFSDGSSCVLPAHRFGD